MISGEHFQLPCRPSHTIPVLSLHAVDDEVLPYGGGHVTTMPRDFPAVLAAEQVAAAWAAIDGCGSLRPGADEEPGDDVSRISWLGCAAEVDFYRLASGGHAWASGGPGRVSASDLVWSLIARSSRG
jgi:polyhydroxybutyrate depolymerase